MSSATSMKVIKIPEGSIFPHELEKKIIELGLKGGLIVGIGGFESLELGILNPKMREYVVNTYKSTENLNLEGVSIIGNYFLRSDGKVATHIHISIAVDERTMVGGHLIQGKVRPFLELFLIEVGEDVKKAFSHRDVIK
ncbi:MAG: PPC domain-containing DNA-binding protein [Fervidicoccaceae archaeon]